MPWYTSYDVYLSLSSDQNDLINIWKPVSANRLQFRVFEFCHILDPTEESTAPVSLHYKHSPVAGTTDKSETYYALAVEAAFIGLGQQRTMPAGVYTQVTSR